MKANVTIVMPIYQNEGSIEKTCRIIADVLDPHAEEIEYSFMMVNDGSTDCSWAVLEKLQQKQPNRFALINFTRNFGQMSALLAGYTHAKGDAVVSISADLQDPPELILDMIKAWRLGEKLVVANRASRNDGVVANILSNVGWNILRRFSVPNMPRGGFDYFLMDREICDYFIKNPEQHLFLQGRLLFYGYKPYVIAYERKKRVFGQSQTTLRRKITYFIDGVTCNSFLPLRLMSLIGVLLFCAGIIYSCFIVWHVIWYGIKVEGWASIMIGVLFLNGLQLLSLGIIGEYLWRNIEQCRNRPHYIIERFLPLK